MPLPDAGLSVEEAALLEPILDEIRLRWKVPVTLTSLISGWQNWVLTVEKGYRLTLDEYVNGLYRRENLGQIILRGPITVNEKISPTIHQADVIFLDATYASPRSLVLGHERVQS